MRRGLSVLFALLLVTSTPATAQSNEAFKRQLRDAVGSFDESDYRKALSGIRPMAQAGNEHAQHVIGFMYHKGFGVVRNLREANRWYRLAAIQGNPDSMVELARLSEQGGVGVPRSVEAAWVLAAYANLTQYYRSNGNPEAGPYMNRLRDEVLTEEEFALANRLFNEIAHNGKTLEWLFKALDACTACR